MKIKLILASNNKDKLREFRELFSDLEDLELLSMEQAGCEIEVEETGTTFEENAYLKAKAVTELTGLPAVSDDSGLEVEALDGEPGVYSARYGPGHDATDEERTDYLLSRLGEEENRRARYVCCLCCTFPDGGIVRARGECGGAIGKVPVGEDGFGYDPVFIPDGYEKTIAQLSLEEKNSFSHRGNAMRDFAPRFKEYSSEHYNQTKS